MQSSRCPPLPSFCLCYMSPLKYCTFNDIISFCCVFSVVWFVKPTRAQWAYVPFQYMGVFYSLIVLMSNGCLLLMIKVVAAEIGCTVTQYTCFFRLPHCRAECCRQGLLSETLGGIFGIGKVELLTSVGAAVCVWHSEKPQLILLWAVRRLIRDIVVRRLALTKSTAWFNPCWTFINNCQHFSCIH